MKMQVVDDDGAVHWQMELPAAPAKLDAFNVPADFRAADGKLTDDGRLALVTAMVETMRRGLEAPFLQPINVDITPDGVGRVLVSVDMVTV